MSGLRRSTRTGGLPRDRTIREPTLSQLRDAPHGTILFAMRPDGPRRECATAKVRKRVSERSVGTRFTALHTLKPLVLKPGLIAKEYNEGKRARFVPPILRLKTATNGDLFHFPTWYSCSRACSSRSCWRF